MKGREENRGHLTREHSSLHNPGQRREGYGRERRKSQGRTSLHLSLCHMHTRRALGSSLPQSPPYVLADLCKHTDLQIPFSSSLIVCFLLRVQNCFVDNERICCSELVSEWKCEPDVGWASAVHSALESSSTPGQGRSRTTWLKEFRVSPLPLISPVLSSPQGRHDHMGLNTQSLRSNVTSRWTVSEFN